MSLPQKSQQYYLEKIGTYKDLQVREVDVPKPRASEVLVKVHAISLQYRDLVISDGRYPAGPEGDVVPCSDMAGEVLSVGEDVTDWKAGDRVCANFTPAHLFGIQDAEIAKTALGAHAPGVLTQYRTFPANALVKIPEHLSYVEASTLPCAALTAYNALHGPKPIKAGDYVLVQGTGGVSIFGLQFAVAAGAVVIATSSSNEKLKKAKELGAKYVINYKETPNWEEEVLKITKGVGVQHIVEVGGPGTMEKSITCAAFGGNINVIGFVAQGDSKDTSLFLRLIFKSILVRGIFIGSVDQFKDMNRLIEANPEKTRPVVDKVFPFTDAVGAYAYLESQKHVGKVVIQVA